MVHGTERGQVSTKVSASGALAAVSSRNLDFARQQERGPGEPAAQAPVFANPSSGGGGGGRGGG